ncbi:TetR/AcrR family transcriptional regulator [Paenibacillus radicis (ex Xue et al. 2023)]|uniref:TetR/AcrR family transcriptional regulator n=1 Tax=Paenibacillus radicis (ex Xue et al. 2023) TaxID=2972489 RepID=A0ABT1YAR0_9BACL|nr:TetR/AcrR family transcriptional regulator [Paenibacillus radicis (ex Xue et al. 2023)]MCR8630272.1 TetR/AcrR family transcriptional regulator [Paenibacillus radicis (ex Xue et al. 2023)]
MPRISKDPEVRRNEILDVAMELFKINGFEHTSVSDIVKKMGVAQGTFYYYFSSKEEVVNAACERTLSSRLADVKHTTENAGLTAFEKLSKVIWDAIPTPQEQTVLDYLHDARNITLHQKWKVAEITALIPYVAEIVRQGVDSGVFSVKQPEEAAEFLLIGSAFWLDDGVFRWTEEELAKKKHALRWIFDRLLGGEKG